MSLTRTAGVKLNRLRTGVGRFGSFMRKWSLASLANCECGASEQTADCIISTCPTHRASPGKMGPRFWTTKQGAGLIPSPPASDLSNRAGWGGKRINLRPSPFLVSDLDDGYPPYDDEEKVRVKR